MARPMKSVPSTGRVTALSLLLGAYAVACAADAGDPLKVEGGPPATMTGGPDEGLGGDESVASSDASVQDDPMVVDVVVGSDGPGTTGVESSAPMEAGAMIPDVGVGPGCADGAQVIVLMPAAGQYNANSGNFMTLGAVCVELSGSVHQGWGISNGQGRMLTLTSAAGMSGPIDASGSIASLPVAPQAGSDGFVYWNFTADTDMVNYTSIYIF
jgi:hypothetical protein